MSADRWPVDFPYISKRLVTEIVQQDRAARRHWRPSFGLQVKVLGVALRHMDPDYSNSYDLARRATEAVHDHTGTLEVPGRYIRHEFPITPGLFTVLMGWDERTHVDIAAMRAVLNVEGIGRTLVALFGSASNYSGRRPRATELPEIPSDVDGLYGILERTREPRDPHIEDHFLERDLGHTPESRADLVVRLLEDRFTGFAPRVLDVLMQVFYVVDEYSLGSSHFNRIVIGAPVWAATPEPYPLRRYGRELR